MVSAAPFHALRLYARLEAPAQEGDDARFWEVTVHDCALTTRHGRVGTDGRAAAVKSLASPEAARAEALRRIAAKQRQGFVLVEELPEGHATSPELVAAIAEQPDSEDGYLVYADWLQAQGDPRGELAVLHYGLLRKPHDARLIRAERQFWIEHDRHMHPARLLEMRNLARMSGRTGMDACVVDWHLGFIRSARIGRRSFDPPYTVRELVAALLAHPSAQLLQELSIGSLGGSLGGSPGLPGDDGGSTERWDYAPVTQAITEAAPACLRSLMLVGADDEGTLLERIHLGPVGELAAALPALERLHLCGQAMSLHGLAAPRVRWFRLSSPGLDTELVRAIAAARWPALEELVIDACDIGGSASSEPIDPGAMAALLAGHTAPRLRKLTVTGSTGTRELVLALAESRLLEQLEAVDLTYGDLGDADVPMLLAQGQKFSHLAVLGLDGNYISRALRPRLRALCREVLLGRQRGAAADIPVITEEQIVEFAPDARSYIAARELAEPRRWARIGSWMTLLWGTCQSSSRYEVFVDAAAMESGCTCPSRKYPCKHALALLMVVARGRAIPVAPPPAGLLEACRANREALEAEADE